MSEIKKHKKFKPGDLVVYTPAILEGQLFEFHPMSCTTVVGWTKNREGDYLYIIIHPLGFSLEELDDMDEAMKRQDDANKTVEPKYYEPFIINRQYIRSGDNVIKVDYDELTFYN